MIDEINILFGKQLRFIRQSKGYSQEKLAGKVNLNRTYIGRIERGERNVTLAVAAKIAAALKTNITVFLTSKSSKCK